MELLDLLATPWPLLALALLVFGFAPRLILRLLVLAFPRGDPRRDEVLGELDAVPYKDRPLFVAEQFEVALIEGFGGRIRWLWTRKVTEGWSLTDGVKMNRRNPGKFYVPTDDEKNDVEPGDIVKLGFKTRSGWGERMWVRVTKRTRRGYVGLLHNSPVAIPDLWHEKPIRFKREHIIDIDIPAEVDDDPTHGSRAE